MTKIPVLCLGGGEYPPFPPPPRQALALVRGRSSALRAPSPAGPSRGLQRPFPRWQPAPFGPTLPVGPAGGRQRPSLAPALSAERRLPPGGGGARAARHPPNPASPPHPPLIWEQEGEERKGKLDPMQTGQRGACGMSSLTCLGGNAVSRDRS